MCARPGPLCQSRTEHPGNGASSWCQGSLTLSSWSQRHGTPGELEGLPCLGGTQQVLLLRCEEEGAERAGWPSSGCGKSLFLGWGRWEAQGTAVPLRSAEVMHGGLRRLQGQPLVPADT